MASGHSRSRRVSAQSRNSSGVVRTGACGQTAQQRPAGNRNRSSASRTIAARGSRRLHTPVNRAARSCTAAWPTTHQQFRHGFEVGDGGRPNARACARRAATSGDSECSSPPRRAQALVPSVNDFFGGIVPAMSVIRWQCAFHRPEQEGDVAGPWYSQRRHGKSFQRPAFVIAGNEPRRFQSAAGRRATMRERDGGSLADL
jgi:hypothetical protein